MIAPTVRDRSRTYDVARGFAVLGILLANIAAFSGPDFSRQMASISANAAGFDRVWEAIQTAFVSGKFRSTLAILFGVGIWLQYEKRVASGTAFYGGYLKRNLWLAIIGLLHGFLIWYGDILFIYSLTAFFACLMVGWSSTVLKAIIGVLTGIAVLLAVLFTVLGMMFAGGGQSAPPSDMGIFAALFDPVRETQIYQLGTYTEQLALRAMQFGAMAILFILIGPFLLPLFLVGLLLAKSGALLHPSAHPTTRNWALGVGLGLGLPLNLAMGALAYARGAEQAMVAVEVIGGPLLAVGYLMGIAVLLEKVRGGFLSNLLASVGRMSFSVYLLQSVIATAIFYSWGLGLFGKVDAAGQLAAVLFIWVAVASFAVLWQRKFALGPMEWLHRSLTEGRRLPLRREAYDKPSPAPEPQSQPALVP